MAPPEDGRDKDNREWATTSFAVSSDSAREGGWDRDRDRSSSSSSLDKLLTGGAAAALRAPPRDVPIFALETLERNANVSGGSVTTGAAANNRVVVGTSGGTCVVYDFATGTSVEIDCAVSSAPSAAAAAADNDDAADVAVGRLWMDPTGRHVIATLHDGLNRAVDTVYFRPTVDARARVLAAVKREGVAVTAVGWHAARCADDSAADVLVGTSEGSLFELSLEATTTAPPPPPKPFMFKSSAPTPPTSPERLFRKLLALDDVREPIAGLHVDCVDGLYTVLAATPTRLYCFTGGATLTATLTGPGGKGPRGGGVEALVEMPVEASHAELHVWGRDSGGTTRHPPDRMAWLVGPGVYYGHLELEGLEAVAADTVLDNHSLIPFPQEGGGFAGLTGAGAGGEMGVPPLSMAATAHHVLVLFPSHIVAVNVVTGDVANTVPLVRLKPLSGGGNFGDRDEWMGAGARWAQETSAQVNARCLATDVSSGVVYLVTATALLEVTVRDEGRDMWRVHLDRNEFSLALEHCGNDDQRGAVHAKQAEMATRAGEHARAAAYYAKAGRSVSFEAVCLLFLERGQDDALTVYLQRRLDAAEKNDDPPQVVHKIANWLADLHVSKACAAGEGTDAEAAATADLRAFLTDYASFLDAGAIKRLLGDYGREEDLAFFAEAMGDWQAVLGFCLRKGYSERAIGVLRKPQVPAADVYKVAPQLFSTAPVEAVDFFIAQGPERLDPVKVLPAFGALLPLNAPQEFFTRGEGGAELEGRKKEAIRFLQHAVMRQGCGNGSLHNYLLLLLVDRYREDPNALMRYVAGAGLSSGGKAYYDQALAARMCEEAGAIRAAIHIYCDVGDYDYAIDLALRVDDLDTAKLVVSKLDAGETGGKAHKRRLWRRIGRGVIERGFGVSVTEDDIEAETREMKVRLEETTKISAMVAKQNDAQAKAHRQGIDEYDEAERRLGITDWSVDDPDTWVLDEDGMRVLEDGTKVDPYPVERADAEAGAVAKKANTSPLASDPAARAAIVKKALALVPESEGLLTVEDLLPYFPDFTVIDEFKEAVLEELGGYAKRIEQSRAEMDEAEALAEKIRDEIAEISTRTIKLNWDDPCSKCGEVITMPPQGFAHYAVQGHDPEAVAASSPLSQFYAFPCGMAFHTTCLIEAGLPWMTAPQRRRCLDLMAVVQPPLTRELKKLCKKWAARVGSGSASAAVEKGERLDIAAEKSTPGVDDVAEPGASAGAAGTNAGVGKDGIGSSSRGGKGGWSQAAATANSKGKGNAKAGSGASAASSSNAGVASKVKESAVEADSLSDKERAVEQLEDLLCDECPYCGEMMLRQVTAPFWHEDEQEEAESWKL